MFFVIPQYIQWYFLLFIRIWYIYAADLFLNAYAVWYVVSPNPSLISSKKILSSDLFLNFASIHIIM